MAEDLDKLIAPFQIKGLVGSRIPVGTRVNELGETENVYEVTSDPEWAEAEGQRKYEFEYMQWHQFWHVRQSIRDPRCTICEAERKFQAERQPHEQNHRARRIYDPSCRFCQDDRFFGRM